MFFLFHFSCRNKPSSMPKSNLKLFGKGNAVGLTVCRWCLPAGYRDVSRGRVDVLDM